MSKQENLLNEDYPYIEEEIIEAEPVLFFISDKEKTS